MTLKKNLLVVLASTVFILLCAYLVRMPQDVLVYGLFVWVAGSVTSLMIEDGLRKSKEKKDALTWQYFVGAGLVLISVLAFLWTVETVTMFEFLSRLGVAVFLGFMGAIWFYSFYRNSIMDAEAIEAERWSKASAKAAKAKTVEDAYKILAKTLRYHLTYDDITGELVLDEPLAFHDGSCLTLAEAVAIKEQDEDDPIIEIRARADRYISSLLKGDA